MARSTLTIPVLVTEGEKDDLVLASHTAHILSCISQAQHSLYEGIGHAPPMEDTARFNHELAESLILDSRVVAFEDRVY